MALTRDQVAAIIAKRSGLPLGSTTVLVQALRSAPATPSKPKQPEKGERPREVAKPTLRKS